MLTDSCQQQVATRRTIIQPMLATEVVQLQKCASPRSETEEATCGSSRNQKTEGQSQLNIASWQTKRSSKSKSDHENRHCVVMSNVEEKSEPLTFPPSLAFVNRCSGAQSERVSINLFLSLSTCVILKLYVARDFKS